MGNGKNSAESAEGLGNVFALFITEADWRRAALRGRLAHEQSQKGAGVGQLCKDSVVLVLSAAIAFFFRLAAFLLALHNKAAPVDVVAGFAVRPNDTKTRTCPKKWDLAQCPSTFPSLVLCLLVSISGKIPTIMVEIF